MMDTDLLVMRDLLCAIVEQAAVDAVEIRSYKDRSKQDVNEHRHRDALEFFNGALFNEICGALGVPEDKIRNEIKRKIERQRQKLIKLIEHETKTIPDMDMSDMWRDTRDKDAYALMLALRQMRCLRQERGGDKSEGLRSLQEVVRQKQSAEVI